jgi:hypothetical protein
VQSAIQTVQGKAGLVAPNPATSLAQRFDSPPNLLEEDGEKALRSLQFNESRPVTSIRIECILNI